MFHTVAYRQNKEVRYLKDIDEISDFIAEPGTIIWLDAVNPSRDEMEKLASEFGFHPLAIDDYFTPHHSLRLMNIQVIYLLSPTL